MELCFSARDLMKWTAVIADLPSHTDDISVHNNFVKLVFITDVHLSPVTTIRSRTTISSIDRNDQTRWAGSRLRRVNESAASISTGLLFPWRHDCTYQN
jgi:hypothetical protein